MGVLQISEGTEAFNYLVLITDCQSVGKVREGGREREREREKERAAGCHW